MRRAAALPMVLFAMSLSSALAVGGTYVARQLAANARVAHRGAELGPAAERAVAGAIASWDSLARSAQSIGAVASVSSDQMGAISTDLWITRISETLYWIVAESRGDFRPPLRRRIGLLVRVLDGAAVPVAQRSWSELP